MTVREFDPAFSHDLRQELVARSETQGRTLPHPRSRSWSWSVQKRPLLTTIVTAAVLLIATVAVLQTTRPVAGPAAPTRSSATEVTDPLKVVTDPTQGDAFLSRSPDVLLHAIGTDSTDHTTTLDLPPGVTTIRIWINCTDGAHFAISLPRHARTGTCGSSDVSPSDVSYQAGSRVKIRYSVPEPDGSAYALLVIALPPKQ